MTDDDPFDRLGGDDDREGDPFERLGAAEDATTEGDSADESPDDGAPKRDSWGPPGEDRRDATTDEEWPGPDAGGADPTTGGAGSTADGVGPDAADATTPAEVDAEASRSTGREGDPFHGVDTPDDSPFDAGGPSVFERVDAGAVDPDEVWESITDDGDGDDGQPSIPDEDRYSEVSKHRFCEGCEHFSPPPDVTCDHETAEIIEFLDMETVRLLDCPVVAEREALERGE